MECNKIIINNNLLHYTNNSNKYSSNEYKSNYEREYFNENKNQNKILLNNKIPKKNYNINNQILINSNIPFSSRGSHKNKIDIYSLGNIEKKRVNKTPQARMHNRAYINYNDININKNDLIYINNDYKKNDYLDFHDIRVDFCLEMLNLNDIKDIFYQKNIDFKEMLYLSQNDMKKMGIPKYSQLIIQKFTKDYVEKASLYNIEELQKFFQLYYRDNIRKIINDKNMRKTFPIRSFSPIAYSTKKLLNKYDYNLGNYNEIPYINDQRNFNTNNYNIVNNYNNNLINKQNNFITNIEQRNCLSASHRRKNPIIQKKENINKILKNSKSSNIYSNKNRIRSISVSNSQKLIDNNRPINFNYSECINNKYLDYENHPHQYQNFKDIKVNNGYKRNFCNYKDVNKKISNVNKNIGYYLDNIRKSKKKEGNFEVLNLAINNFYKENIKNKKDIIQRKMNQNRLNYNLLFKERQNNKENHINKYFNSFENNTNLKDNYFKKINFSEIQFNNKTINKNDTNFSMKNNNLINSSNAPFSPDKYIQRKENNNKNINKNIKQHHKNSNYNNFINGKIMKNKTGSKNYNNKNKNEKKPINTSIIYKSDYSKNINKKSNNSKDIISFAGNSINLIKNNKNNNNKKNNINKGNLNNKNNNINNQNLIINERNNFNIYYDVSNLINNDIFNYEKISIPSEHLLNSQLISTSVQAKNNKNILRNVRMKEIFKNINTNINNRKNNNFPLTNNYIKQNKNENNIKIINKMSSKGKNINNKNINNNFTTFSNQKNKNIKSKKLNKNNNIRNINCNINMNKRSSSLTNNKNNRINMNNKKFIKSDKINNNNNFDIYYSNNDIKKPKNISNSIKNIYMNNMNNTEDSDYYINYL